MIWVQYRKILLSPRFDFQDHWDEWQPRFSRSCYKRFRHPAPEYKLLSNFQQINGSKLKNNNFNAVFFASNTPQSLAPFLKTQLVDVETL
jgi:hypothetical protein